VSATGLYTPDELYRLLPALHRIRDIEEGEPLRELLEVLTEQVNAIAESLEQLYDDQFIETCADWVAPYIGDLIGYRGLHGVVPRVASPRAEVANTIRYRRRKGTASMLEQLARDVTDWPARAVEFFELLVGTQFMNHVRPHAGATASLRDAGALELGGRFGAGAFDGLAHTAEMRGIAGRGGRYNIRNVGIFLWRVQARRVPRAPLAPADGSGRRFRLDPLAVDRQLFGAPRTEEEITHIAEPFDVPLALTTRWLSAHKAQLYGAGGSLLLEVETGGGVSALAAGDVRVCSLADDPALPGAWAHEPQPGDTFAVVDPLLGRVAFGDPAPAGATRLATYHYGTALAIGGGGYDRSSSLQRMAHVVTVDDGDDLAPALGGVAGGGSVDITDSHRYATPATITAAAPAVASSDKVVALRAANRQRPYLQRGDETRLALAPNTTVVLDGLLLAGAPLVIEEAADSEPRTLVLRHCTLVPGLTRGADGAPATLGAASLVVLHPFTTVTLDHCICGPIVAVAGAAVTATDSVIDSCGEQEIAFCGRAAVAGGLRTVAAPADRLMGDGLSPGGHLTLGACTVVGRLHATQLDVSNSILVAAAPGPGPAAWPAPVWAQRRQIGCMRFSYVPPGSRTPRRFECAGDLPAHRPQHTSLRYGDPGYGQLRRSTHDAVRTGADDESEMGATHELHQPQRETNLRLRLDEYLRYGLEAGFFYAT
jgi:hypothetical protein